MALIDAEEELFGLREAEVAPSVHLSASEDEYDDDPEEGEGSRPQQQPADAQEEATDAGAAKIIKPKRVIKNPQPKLDVARLCGPRGIGIVQKWLSDTKYKGKGYETEDLGVLLKRLQHWAHRLYPKLPFQDCVAQIEKLGNKKPLQVNVKRLRLDMYETPTEGTQDGLVTDAMDPGSDNENDAPAAAAADDQPDVFDELLRQSGAPDSLHTRVVGTDVGAAPAVEAPRTIALTEEQRARIERNKQLALERRQARLAAQAAGETSSNTGSTVNTSTPVAAVARLTGEAREAVTSSLSKRKRIEEDDSDDERPQATPADVRNLREAMLNNVLSQNTAVLPKERAENSAIGAASEKNSSSNDNCEEMEVDEILESLNKAERDAMNETDKHSVIGSGSPSQTDAVLQTKSQPSESNASLDDISSMDEESSTCLPNVSKSLSQNDCDENLDDMVENQCGEHRTDGSTEAELGCSPLGIANDKNTDSQIMREAVSPILPIATSGSNAVSESDKICSINSDTASPSDSDSNPSATAIPSSKEASPAEASPAKASPAKVSSAKASPAEASPAEASPPVKLRLSDSDDESFSLPELVQSSAAAAAAATGAATDAIDATGTAAAGASTAAVAGDGVEQLCSAAARDTEDMEASR